MFIGRRNSSLRIPPGCIGGCLSRLCAISAVMVACSSWFVLNDTPSVSIARTVPNPPPSFRRRPEGGFTFQVQHAFQEYFCRGLVVQALSRGIVVGLNHLCKPLHRQRRQVGLAGQSQSQPADGVLHPALLPRGVGIAEEGFDTQIVESVMEGELGPVVEGNRPSPLGRQLTAPATWRFRWGLDALPGGLTAMRMREWRSCMVSTACPYVLNSIRSASQWPGVRRSPALRGRSAIGRRIAIKEAGLPPLRPRQPRFDLPRGR